MEGQVILPSGEILSYGENLLGVQVYAIIEMLEYAYFTTPMFIRKATDEEVELAKV